MDFAEAGGITDKGISNVFFNEIARVLHVLMSKTNKLENTSSLIEMKKKAEHMGHLQIKMETINQHVSFRSKAFEQHNRNSLR